MLKVQSIPKVMRMLKMLTEALQASCADNTHININLSFLEIEPFLLS